MYAVIETGGKQYRVEKGQQFDVEKLEREQEEMISVKEVLLVADGERVEIGNPYVEGSEVQCKVVGHRKGTKVVHFRYRRRKRFERKVGHRQSLTTLRVEEIKL